MPSRQTQRDLEQQRAIAKRIETTRPGWKVKEYAPFHSLDWYIEKEGKVIVIAELKRRSNRHDFYDTVLVALNKWVTMLVASLAGPVPLFVYEFTDGLYYIDARRFGDLQPSVGGRTDRPDTPHDIEPVLWVSHERWKLL